MYAYTHYICLSTHLPRQVPALFEVTPDTHIRTRKLTPSFPLPPTRRQVPAVFGVTTDPFLAFSSNAFAILGLRQVTAPPTAPAAFNPRMHHRNPALHDPALHPSPPQTCIPAPSPPICLPSSPKHFFRFS
jgi:hypothetical protein